MVKTNGAADGVGAAVKAKLKAIISKVDNTDWTAEEIKSLYEKEDQSVMLKIYNTADVS